MVGMYLVEAGKWWEISIRGWKKESLIIKEQNNWQDYTNRYVPYKFLDFGKRLPDKMLKVSVGFFELQMIR